MFSYEFELVAIVSEFLKGQGYKVYLEVPNMGQSTDLVGIKGQRITFFEAKMSNWKRAIEQCNAHQLVADYICIALGRNNASEELISIVSKLGYGLILCNPETKECSWLETPKLNHQIWEPQRKQMLKNLRIINHAR